MRGFIPMLEPFEIVDGSSAEASSQNNEREPLFKKKTKLKNTLHYFTFTQHHFQPHVYEKLYNWLSYHSPSYYFWRKYYFSKDNNIHSLIEDVRHEIEQRPKKEKSPFHKIHFLKGYRYAMEYFWPISLGLLLIHDFYVYALYPDERFDTLLEDIFLANANNQVSWTKMGSDLIHEPSFWYPSILLLTLPILMGVAEPFYRKLMGKFLINTSWTQCLTEDSINNLTRIMVVHSRPLSFLRRQEALQRLEWGFFWEKELTAENKKAILDFFVFTSGYDQLLRVVSAFSDENIKRLIKQNYLSNDEGKIFRELKQFACEALPSREKNIKFYAKETIKKIFAAYGLSASFYYIALVVRKAIAIYQYFHDKENCHEPKVWNYIPAKGNYDCTICGDWPFVYLGDINSPQGCLDGLISSGKNITQYDIARLAAYNISTLDLSSTPINKWSDDYFQAMFKQFESLLSVEIVNLSSTALARGWTNSKAIIIKYYINQLNIKALDLSKQNLGANTIQTLLEGINISSPLNTLNLANNGMADTGAQIIGSFLSDHTLSSLDVSYNQFSSNGVRSITQSLNNHKLAELYLRGISIDQETFSQLATNVTQSAIKIFDISDSDLTGIDTTSLGELIPGSALKALRINNAYLSDGQVFTLSNQLSNSSLEQISIADNFISDAGAISFIWNLKGSQVSTINLANNPLTDNFLKNTKSVIQTLSIRTLNLSYGDASYCQFSSQALYDFIKHLPPTLKSLSLANTTLDDTGIQTIITFQINGTYSLEHLDVSFTLISDASKQSIYDLLLQNTPLLELKLSGTYLTDISSEMLVPAILHNTNLKILDVSSTYFTFRGATQLVKAVTDHKQIISLSMDNVPITDESVYALKLIQGKYIDQTLLTSEHLNLDQRRALSQAKPSTDLQYISVQNCNLTTKSAQYLCRILPYSDSSPDKLSLGGNAVDFLEINLLNCVESTASKNVPWFSIDSLKRLGESAYQTLRWFTKQNNQIGNTSTKNYLNFLPAYMQQTPSVRSLPFNSEFVKDSSVSQLPSSSQALAGVMAMLCLFTYFFKKTNDSKIPLNDHYLSMVNASLKSLRQLEKMIKLQAQGRLGQSGLFFDRFEYTNQKINKIQNDLETILKRKYITPRSLQAIQEDLQRIQKMISKNKQTNDALRKIQIKEARRERRNYTSGKVDISIVTRCTLTGELQHRFDATSNNEKNFSQTLPSFLNSVSNFFSSFSVRDFFDSQPSTDQIKFSL